jgi:cytochrome oxidase Cu insertion factor (SCO1/SenC/PrrC family)/uncharacterized membrane protein YozB (DUF420 family)
MHAPLQTVARRLAALLAAGLLCACGPRAGSAGPQLDAPAASEASFGELPEFRFVERSGREVTREDLLGRPWIAGFIFTRCSTICPALTRQMARAQAALAGTDALVVAFSVDPDHDTPEVLREYADEVCGADPERWLFLTGDQEALHRLVRESFGLAVEIDPAQDPGLRVAHSSKLAVVDAEGRIRGYYDGDTDAGLDRAVARARFLAGVPSVYAKINASLNAVAALLLAAGYLAIRRRRRTLHGRLMQTAFVVSAAFLACYLYYHLKVIPEQGGPVRFRGGGAAKGLYLALLGTHVLGAVVNLPMVLRTLWLAHRERWDAHKRLARKTLPLWMYVSVTGVLVYFALYVWNPGMG